MMNNKLLGEKFAQDFNKKYGIITYSGTLAIEIALSSLGLKKGDKILVLSEICYSIVNTILKECNEKVYVLGHANPDADSIFSSYILTQILKSKKINAEFCILNKDYNFSNKDKELIEAFLPEKPTIITNTKDKKYILVDTNSKNDLVNVIGAFDHHKITVFAYVFKIIHRFYRKFGKRNAVALTAL